MDFTFQRKQLEDYITQMSAWLKSMEDSLVSSPTGSDPEDICKVKVLSIYIQHMQWQSLKNHLYYFANCVLKIQYFLIKDL